MLALLDETPASLRQRRLSRAAALLLWTVPLIDLAPNPAAIDTPAHVTPIYLAPASRAGPQAIPFPSPASSSAVAAGAFSAPLAEVDVAGVRLRIARDDTEQLPAVLARSSGFLAYVSPGNSYSSRLFAWSGAAWAELDQTAELESFWCLRLPDPTAWSSLQQLLRQSPPKAAEAIWVLLQPAFFDQVRAGIDSRARQQAVSLSLAEIRLDSRTSLGFTILHVK